MLETSEIKAPRACSHINDEEQPDIRVQSGQLLHKYDGAKFEE
jgi:hypothetical protein